MKHLIIIFIMLPALSFGQVHIKKQKFLQINAGIYDGIKPSLDSYVLSAEIGKYGKRLNAHSFGFLYGHKLSSNAVPVDRYEGFAKLEHNIYSSSNLTSTFKILGTVNFGYESINNEKPQLDGLDVISKSEFIFGLGTGAEYELSPIVLGVRTSYNFFSNYQKFTTYPYVGVKIHF